MANPRPKARRCAVYTRKSSEEGLEQDFNSLHAQREACESFIKSQQGEGWRLVPAAYDDGGLSGGTMERAGLQRLMEDVRAGRIDTVVVYKVDRLTRSLMDFAKIVELFDRQGVTFVAVTQQFNTTTSMGRLTLNILLSFAQFEREIAGERIRDKIAASKRKGMWMGGTVPLGYDVKERKLVVNAAEAETVRLIYRRYRELGSVRLLEQDLDRRGTRSKVRTLRTGPTGGAPYSRGALYALLGNPLYIGEIAHKGSRFPGQHEAIVDRDLWDAAQSQLAAQGALRRGAKTSPSAAALTGLIFDQSGERLTPTHAAKRGRRYSYYVSRSLMLGQAHDRSKGWRLPARQIEDAVGAALLAMLSNRAALARHVEEVGLSASALPSMFDAASDLCRRLQVPEERASAIGRLLARVELRQDRMQITMNLAPLLKDKESSLQEPLMIDHEMPFVAKRRGVELKLVLADEAERRAAPDPILIKELARAQRCFDALSTGDALNLAALAAREGVSDRYISLLLPLAFLAPDIVEAIVEGRQPADLTAHRLIRKTDLPIDWQSQRQALGFL
jgi:site-specific DNA recombinase